MKETGEEQVEELHLLGAGHLGGRGQCQLASNLYLSSTYMMPTGGKGMERSQQVLEDHLSRVTSLLVPSGLCTPHVPDRPHSASCHGDAEVTWSLRNLPQEKPLVWSSLEARRPPQL